MTMKVRRRLAVCGGLVGGLLVLTVKAQAPSSQTLEELQAWHDQLIRPHEVISLEQARQARDKLGAWNLAPDKLEAEQRGQWLRVQIATALALGDAATARQWLARLEQEQPEERETLRLAWMTAVVAGDAELAQRTLDKLSERGLAGEKAIALRSRRLRMVGQPAPDVSVRTEDGPVIALRQRQGVVLVVDFWRAKEPPSDKVVKALHGLYEAWRGDSKIAFLGVNADPPDQLQAAKQFATDQGYHWPQLYERAGRAASLTDLTFQVSASAWQVVIDGEGNVRAVGSATDPEFVYAVRAAVAEAKGQYPVLRPRTTEGAEAPSANAGASTEPARAQESKPEPEKRAAAGDLPITRTRPVCWIRPACLSKPVGRPMPASCWKR